MGKPFTVNINRFDPYKTFRFLVYFGGTTSPVAAVSKVGGLKRSSDVIEYKQGGDAITRKGISRSEKERAGVEWWINAARPSLSNRWVPRRTMFHARWRRPPGNTSSLRSCSQAAASWATPVRFGA